MRRIDPLQLLDSRRLTGPNILWDKPGAVIDVSFPLKDAGAVVEAWGRQARRILDAVGWRHEQTRVRDIPVVLVTGTNGKTTTVRLVGAMVAETGKVTGLTTTDGVHVAGDLVSAGDYSGPEGARTVLRDRRVETAVLETARGGILRRGLAVRSADAAIITNVADDHLGEFGIHDLHAL